MTFPINQRIPNTSANNTNIVIPPTIMFFKFIPSGLFPNAALITIPKQYKQYLINSHIF